MEPEQEMQRQHCLRSIRRIVVKVGSAVLAGDGQLRPRAVARLAADVAATRRSGLEVVLVSSGAVASAFRYLGAKTRPTDITVKQAAAALGQPLLMAAYGRAFAKYRTRVAQVLLTADDLDRRPRYLNARHTLLVLLRHGMLPIINENDSVSTDEMKFGDNDHLSALVASLVSADLLIMLSNVDGLYRGGNPQDVIPVIPADLCPLVHVQTRRRSATGTGGMTTKIQAATLAGRWGIPTVVARGDAEGTVQRIVRGEPLGTMFVPRPYRLRARKRWIAQSRWIAGTLIIDEGACAALQRRGASLLPSGIRAVEGDFVRGAHVRIVDPAGAVIGRGLTTYSSAETKQIMGRKSTEIAPILGYTYGPEVVHRDDLVLLSEEAEP